MGRTEDSLKAAFAGESQANRKYTAFARKADEEGYPEVASLFRATAEGETAHALQHLHFLKGIKGTRENIQAALDGETEEYTKMYPEMAQTARQEGHEDIARWFEAAARAEKAHADRFREALKNLG